MLLGNQKAFLTNNFLIENQTFLTGYAKEYKISYSVLLTSIIKLVLGNQIQFTADDLGQFDSICKKTKIAC